MILAVALAFAADPAWVVLPASGGPDEGAVGRALGAAGLVRGRSTDVAHFVKGVAHLPLREGLGPDCHEPVTLRGWRARRVAAETRFARFDAEGALSDLLDLELELECLGEPLPAEDLMELDVDRAEAHLLLASASGDDPGQAAFHAQEASAALDRVLAVGKRPDTVSPDLLDALDAAGKRRAAQAPSRIVVVGQSRSEALWVNGKPTDGEVIRGVAGDNLVQRVAGGHVVASLRVQTREGESAIVDVSGDDTPLRDVVDRLVRRPPPHADEVLLVALARVKVDDPVVYVGWDGDDAAVWQVLGSGLARLVVPNSTHRVPTRAVDAHELVPRPVSSPTAWRAAAGLWLGGGWRGSDAAGLLAAGLTGRVALSDVVAGAWTVLPRAAAASFDPSGEGVVAEVPVRLGVRYGSHITGWAAEVGGDLGLVLSDTPVRPLLEACGAAVHGGEHGGGIRWEGCVETDFAEVSLHAGLVIETRL